MLLRLLLSNTYSPPNAITEALSHPGDPCKHHLIWLMAFHCCHVGDKTSFKKKKGRKKGREKRLQTCKLAKSGTVSLFFGSWLVFGAGVRRGRAYFSSGMPSFAFAPRATRIKGLTRLKRWTSCSGAWAICFIPPQSDVNGLMLIYAGRWAHGFN